MTDCGWGGGGQYTWLMGVGWGSGGGQARHSPGAVGGGGGGVCVQRDQVSNLLTFPFALFTLYRTAYIQTKDGIGVCNYNFDPIKNKLYYIIIYNIYNIYNNNTTNTTITLYYYILYYYSIYYIIIILLYITFLYYIFILYYIYKLYLLAPVYSTVKCCRVFFL